MSITHFPPRPLIFVHVEADIPENQRAEFHQAMMEITAGRRPRLEALARQEELIKASALIGLQKIEGAISQGPSTDQTRRLLHCLAGAYNGQDYPFDLTMLRFLDEALCNACLDYLNYDRLGHTEVHTHLKGGDSRLHRWLADAGIQPSPRRPEPGGPALPALVSVPARPPRR